MGSNKKSQKRRAKPIKGLQRNKPIRSPYEKILIVCEGEKTEPNYFEDLIDYYELNTANVAVDGSSGSSPKSILEHAIKLKAVEERTGDAFDKVYCVFDRDSHETYDSTVSRIKDLEPAGIFYATTSVPCFEYWLLLHFEYTTKAYAAAGKKSVAEMVLKDLVRHMPEYKKGAANIYSVLVSRIEIAKTHAVRSLKAAREIDDDNPTTQVGKLVNKLQHLKK